MEKEKQGEAWEFESINGNEPEKSQGHLPLDFLGDVELEFEVILGRSKCTVRELLSLSPGAIIELDRSTGEALDLYMNGKKFARCEVLVMDEKFGVRITEIVPVKE